MINPGTQPVAGAREDLAAANLAVFLDVVTARGARLAGDPVRDAGADTGGRFAWLFPMAAGTSVRVLMPGVELARVRDDLSAQAPCLLIDEVAWWWNDAVSIVASPHP